MTKFTYKIALILGIITTTILGLLFLQPWFFKVLPSDYNRHIVLHNHFKEENKQDEIMVFGDSRTMFGVDTKQIENQLDSDINVYNLSSVDQNIYESSYFYSKIEENTKIVVQCVSSSFFTNDKKHELRDEKAIAMFLSGYRIDKNTKDLIPNYKQLFEHSQLKNYYASKSYTKSYLNHMIRPFLDNESFDESKRLSKYFPYIYTTNKHPEYPYFQENCDNYIPTKTAVSQIDFLVRSNQFFKNQNTKYMLVLMPVNPDICSSNTHIHEFARYLESRTQINILDLSDLLEADDFYDSRHPNKEGAKLISEKITRELKEFIN